MSREWLRGRMCRGVTHAVRLQRRIKTFQFSDTVRKSASSSRGINLHFKPFSELHRRRSAGSRVFNFFDSSDIQWFFNHSDLRVAAYFTTEHADVGKISEWWMAGTSKGPLIFLPFLIWGLADAGKVPWLRINPGVWNLLTLSLTTNAFKKKINLEPKI